MSTPIYPHLLTKSTGYCVLMSHYELLHLGSICIDLKGRLDPIHWRRVHNRRRHVVSPLLVAGVHHGICTIYTTEILELRGRPLGLRREERRPRQPYGYHSYEKSKEFSHCLETPKKRDCFVSCSTISMAPTEETALDTLRLFLSRRGLPTETTRVTTEDDVKANLYTIGKVFVIFNQKQTTSLTDIVYYRKFAAENGYSHGMVVVSRSKPSDNVLLAMKAAAKDHVHFFYLPELQYDITQSRWSMPHRIMKPDEVTNLLKEKNITKPEVQLLSIDSQDIQARIIGAIPGDVIEVIRHSDTAGQSKVWRYCIADANVV